MTLPNRMLAGMLALAFLGACAPMQSHERPADGPLVHTEAGTDSNDARSDSGCPSCGVVRSITQVAGDSVSKDLTNDGERYDLYRIDVDLNGGASYSIDQRDAEDLHKGSSIEVRENHVYPRN